MKSFYFEKKKCTITVLTPTNLELEFEIYGPYTACYKVVDGDRVELRNMKELKIVA